MARIDGIDISYANPQVNFPMVKAAGIGFVIIRTGYLDKTDDRFRSHIEAAQKAGMNIGVYCYCLADSAERARKDAQYVLKLIRPYKLTYPVFYDIEDERLEKLSKKKLTEIASAFLTVIASAGYRAGLYANPSWLENKLIYNQLENYELWLAHWTKSASKPSRYAFGQSMWQWGSGSVSGVNGSVDRNISFVDYALLSKNDKTIKNNAFSASVFLNIRSKPSLSAIKLGIIPPGTVITVTDNTPVYADGYAWVKIRYGSINGYVAQKYLTKAV